MKKTSTIILTMVSGLILSVAKAQTSKYEDDAYFSPSSDPKEERYYPPDTLAPAPYHSNYVYVNNGPYFYGNYGPYFRFRFFDNFYRTCFPVHYNTLVYNRSIGVSHSGRGPARSGNSVSAPRNSTSENMPKQANTGKTSTPYHGANANSLAAGNSSRGGFGRSGGGHSATA